MSRARMVALTFFMFELSNWNDFYFSDIYFYVTYGTLNYQINIFVLHIVPLIL